MADEKFLKDPERAPHAGPAAAWDDGELRSMIEKACAGIPPQPVKGETLDWNKIRREERWRRRLRQGLAGMQAKAGEWAAGAGEQVAALLRAPETLGAAAIELTLDRSGIGRISLDLIEGLMRPQAGLQLAYSPAGERGDAGTAEPGSGSSAALFSAGIPGALLSVDAARNRVVLEFLDTLPEALVLLVPEQTGEGIRAGELQTGQRGTRYEFRDVPPGDYLFFFCPLR